MCTATRVPPRALARSLLVASRPSEPANAVRTGERETGSCDEGRSKNQLAPKCVSCVAAWVLLIVSTIVIITSTRDCLSSVTSTYTLVRSVRYGYGMWRRSRPGGKVHRPLQRKSKWNRGNATGPKLDVVRKLYDRVQLSTVSPIVMLLFML